MQAITTQFNAHEQAHWSSILLEKGVSLLPLAFFKVFSSRRLY
jgi:hypothetical protein